MAIFSTVGPKAHQIGDAGLRPAKASRARPWTGDGDQHWRAQLASAGRRPAVLKDKACRPGGLRYRRGSALLTVLWISAALAAVGFALANTVRGETERTSTTVD